MKELLRKTLELVRRYPVLWSPCAVAVILHFFVDRLERIWIRWLVNRDHTGHSVLGLSTSVPADPSTVIHSTYLLTTSVGVILEFVTVCLFLAALLVTTEFINRIKEEQQPGAGQAFETVASRWQSLFGLSLKFMLGLACVGGVLALSAGSPLAGVLYNSKRSYIAVWALSIGLVACAYWFLSPATIHFLRNTPDSTVTLATRRTAVIVAIAAEATSAPLQAIAQFIELHIGLTENFSSSVLLAINTVVVNLPQVFKFVALGLLATSVIDESKVLEINPGPPVLPEEAHEGIDPQSPPVTG